MQISKFSLHFRVDQLLNIALLFVVLVYNVKTFTETIQLILHHFYQNRSKLKHFPTYQQALDLLSLVRKFLCLAFQDGLCLPFNMALIANKSFPGMQDFLEAMKKGIWQI